LKCKINEEKTKHRKQTSHNILKTTIVIRITTPATTNTNSLPSKMVSKVSELKLAKENKICT